MTEQGPKTHHVVIVGAGFGGIYALRTLQKLARSEQEIEITLIDKNDTFVFIPMIHEVATGLLRPDSITMPLRLFSSNHVRNIIQGTVSNVDNDKKIVTAVRCEGTTEEISYDSLIIATGSMTNFFGVPGAAEHSFPLRTLDDARRIKNQIIATFDAADEYVDPAERERLTRFVIVGGGATGVEMAAEFGECLCEELPGLFPRLKGHGEVVIVDRGERLLAEGDPWFSQKAEEALLQKPCTKIMHETVVEEVTPDGVKTNNGIIRSATVIWCAGVGPSLPSVLANTAPMYEERSKRLVVTPELNTAAYPDVFVVGDAAAVTDKETGKPYGMRAQFAVRQGTHAAENIIAGLRGQELQPFSFREQGFLVSLGKSKGIAKIGSMKFSGRTAWVIYHVAYIRSLVGMRAKLRTLLDWTINLFGSRDFSRV
jgi:NADH dehydrogenase